MRAAVACSLLALSACPAPYDAAAAGLVAVDGGYDYPKADGGVIFFPDIDAAVPDQLANPPTMQQLCMLWIGDVSDMTDYPHRTGTWIEDVKGILGKPPRNGEMDGEDSSSLTYLWKGQGDEPAGVTLSFEHVLMQYAGDNGGPPHGCFEPSFWLNGIQMRDGSFLPCWRWQIGEPGYTDAKDQIGASVALTNQCLMDNPHPNDCYEKDVSCTPQTSNVKIASCVAQSPSNPAGCF